MLLYIIRHADAVPQGKGDVNSDADRPLTEKGRAQSHALAKALQQRGVHLDVILTSPLLRARQTAEDMVDVWEGHKPEVQICEELAPGVKPGKLARALRKLKREAIAVVGHQPDLSAHLGWFVGSKKTRTDMAKAGAARVNFTEAPDKGSGELVWLVTPEWFMETRKTGGHSRPHKEGEV
jgi:phosphohistidine phosphatase